MSPQKFTPGPWCWNEAGYDLRPVTVSSDVTCVLCLESKGMIARPQSRPLEETESEIDANLRLIAAAPELYEAAAAVAALYADEPEDELDPAWGALRAALAKAVRS